MPIKDLDTEQSIAATLSDSEVAVSAGAGSGKTRLLVSRYLYYIRRDHLPLSSVAAITFTNKAADQMKERIAGKAYYLAGEEEKSYDRLEWLDIAENIHTAPISTIHSFCSSILRSHPVECGFDPFFTVLDEVTGSGLKRNVVNLFVAERITDIPDDMGFLLDVFGMRGLKRLLREFLDNRLFLVHYLDMNEHTGELDGDYFRNLYTENLAEKAGYYRDSLTQFHALRPDGDRLTAVYDLLADCFTDLVEKIQTGSVDPTDVKTYIEAIDLRGGSVKRWGAKNLKSLKSCLDECREFLTALAGYFDHDQDVIPRATAFLIREYRILERRFLDVKKQRLSLDNDDLLIETWRLLRTNSRVCQHIARSYRHVLVDEFQDTDRIQMDILRMITGNSAAMLFAVGDPKQSIYRFRGADVVVFNEYMLKAAYKSLKTNYRSSPGIIAFVNAAFGAVMGEEPKREFEAVYIAMKPKRKDVGDSHDVEIVVAAGDDERSPIVQEAEFIARRALELSSSERERNGYSFRDMALLVRRSTITHYYEEAFLRFGIPYANLAGGRLSESPEVYDLGGFCAWLCCPEDPALLTAVLLSPLFSLDPDTLLGIRLLAGTPERIPEVILAGDVSTGGFQGDERSLARIRELLGESLRLRDRLPIRDQMERICDRTGYTLSLLADRVEGERSLAVLDMLFNKAADFERNGGTLDEFAELLLSGEGLANETACVETRDDAISIMTIHGAKGLEFKVVFLADISGAGKSFSGGVAFDSALGPGYRYNDGRGGTMKTYAAWKAEQLEKEKNAAESKRLFYVGCTRAEDRLILSGEEPPKSPDETYEKENWMNWLFTAFSLPRDTSVEHLETDYFLFRRITGNAQPDEFHEADYWKKVIEESGCSGDIDPARVEALTAPIKPVPYSQAPEHISVTELIDYCACPALYGFRHMRGLEGASPEPAEGALGMLYGRTAHAVLEHADLFGPVDWEALIERYGGVKMPVAQKQKLRQDLLIFGESELFRPLRDAVDVRREVPFGFIVKDTLIRGTIDLMYRSGRGTVIVDYKTGTVDGAAADDYRLQLGIYAVAVFRAEYTVPAELVIHSLGTDESLVIPCDRELVDDISARCESALDSMAAGDFSPSLSDRCGSCAYRALCGRG